MATVALRTKVMKEAITVVCRIRPLNQAERTKSSAACLTFPSSTSVCIGGKTYTFDMVFTPTATQTEVYEKSAKSIVASVLNGYNGTLFAYGQTASGKTYTMEGRMKDAEHKGIIPRIIEDIFLHIEKMDENLEFLIKVSYFELYMEKIKDLLDISKTNLPIHETKDRVAYVKGVTERFVSCADDILDILDEGKMNRHVSVTNMNEHSSRSHSIFRICIQQNNRETGEQLNGSLYLVDLAGSEKVCRSGAEGSTLDEAKNINKSLSTLGNVINALVEGNTHVPYRDSKLTRILQQSLGGNSKTTIIIAASPAASNEAETRSTLIFGVRAKNIKNQVVPNTQLTSEEWRRLYERELDRSRQLYSALTNLDAEVRRWRNGETIPREKWFTEDQYGKSFYELANELSEICTAAFASETLFTGGATDPCFSSAGVIPLSDSARLKIRRPTSSDDTQLAELFRLLDEKDDEINQQCQLVARLEVQLTRTRDDYARASRENDKLQTLLQKAQRDADVRRNEVKDVLQALEELAITYDEKNTECKKVAKEMEDVTTEMNRIKEQLDKHESDAEELRTNSATLREKLRELIYSLNVELHELGCQLNEVITHTTPERSSTVEEQAAVLKLYVLQIKSELNTLLKGTRVVAPDIRIIQSSPTETLYSTHTPLPMTEYSEEVQREYERKMKELRSLLKESETTAKRKQEQLAELESQMRKLNQELLEQRVHAQLLNDLKQTTGMNEHVFSRVQVTVERAATHIQDQLTRAKGDAETALNTADKLREENVILKLQLDRVVSEADMMRSRLDSTDSPKRQAQEDAARIQAKSELKAMEETVAHELSVLNSLRRMFITELKNRIKKASTKEVTIMDEESVDTQSVGTAVQRERIQFMKSSLDNLTRAHKQLVRDNADLRCEIPKLEKRVKASLERIKDLEVALRESKEAMIRDKRRYNQEIDRIKETGWARANTRLRTNIGKPIRAGQTKDVI